MTKKATKKEQPYHWDAILESVLKTPGMMNDAFRMFHSYSIGNQLLALFQCWERGIEPGPISTFKGWKAKGRFVSKGQKALTLCMPIIHKRTVKEKDEDGNEVERDASYRTFIWPNRWFVLSQTEGDDIDASEELPSWDREKALENLGITEEHFTHTDGNVGGYAREREIAVNPIHPRQHQIRFHELAHVVLGHTAETGFVDGLHDRTPRDIRELEAECVALLLAEALGLEGAEFSRGYVQHWYTKGDTVPEKSAQRIFTAAHKILEAGK